MSNVLAQIYRYSEWLSVASLWTSSLINCMRA